ncbi:MAG: 50S ribosomal protein L17 [Candidatus Atribacteria bacterium]|nr:50S ribosomal protein L17 [Candidatus Atribacteria bacterium]
MKRGKLGRTTSHKECMMSNLLISLIKQGKLETTETKAKCLKPLFEKIVSKTIKGGNSSMIEIISWVRDKEAFKILNRSIAPHLRDRKGGYCRLIKTGFRRGDGAPLVLVEVLSE